MRDTIDMAREAGFEAMRAHGLLPHVPEDIFIANACITKEVNRLVALARADEREIAIERAVVAMLGASHELTLRVVRAIRARGNT
jgi:hypothetical protein